jgi:hypothetical protein
MLNFAGSVSFSDNGRCIALVVLDAVCGFAKSVSFVGDGHFFGYSDNDRSGCAGCAGNNAFNDGAASSCADNTDYYGKTDYCGR